MERIRHVGLHHDPKRAAAVHDRRANGEADYRWSATNVGAVTGVGVQVATGAVISEWVRTGGSVTVDRAVGHRRAVVVVVRRDAAYVATRVVVDDRIHRVDRVDLLD